MFAGFCYTQLTDTFQEANGLFTAQREPKFDIGAMHRATRGVRQHPAEVPVEAVASRTDALMGEVAVYIAGHGRASRIVVGASPVLARRGGAVSGGDVSGGVGTVPDADPAVSPRPERRHHPDTGSAGGRCPAAVAMRGGSSVRRDAGGAASPSRAGASPIGVVPGVRDAGQAARACVRRARHRPNARGRRRRSARRLRRCRWASRSRASALRSRRRRSRQAAQDLFARLGVTPGLNAVRVGRPFFDHLEVWPDILLPELRIAVEYDSTAGSGWSMSASGRSPIGARTACCVRRTGRSCASARASSSRSDPTTCSSPA